MSHALQTVLLLQISLFFFSFCLSFISQHFCFVVSARGRFFRLGDIERYSSSCSSMRIYGNIKIPATPLINLRQDTMRKEFVQIFFFLYFASWLYLCLFFTFLNARSSRPKRLHYISTPEFMMIGNWERETIYYTFLFLLKENKIIFFFQIRRRLRWLPEVLTINNAERPE